MLYPAGKPIVAVVVGALARVDFDVEVLGEAADGMTEVEYLPEIWDTPHLSISISIKRKLEARIKTIDTVRSVKQSIFFTLGKCCKGRSSQQTVLPRRGMYSSALLSTDLHLEIADPERRNDKATFLRKKP